MYTLWVWSAYVSSVKTNTTGNNSFSNLSNNTCYRHSSANFAQHVAEPYNTDGNTHNNAFQLNATLLRAKLQENVLITLEIFGSACLAVRCTKENRVLLTLNSISCNLFRNGTPRLLAYSRRSVSARKRREKTKKVEMGKGGIHTALQHTKRLEQVTNYKISCPLALGRCKANDCGSRLCLHGGVKNYICAVGGVVPWWMSNFVIFKDFLRRPHALLRRLNRNNKENNRTSNKNNEPSP